MKIKIDPLPIVAATYLSKKCYYISAKENTAIFRAGKNYYFFDTKRALLGKGSYGSVYLAYQFDMETHTFDTDYPVAIKTLRPYTKIVKDPATKQETQQLVLPDREKIKSEFKYLNQYGEPSRWVETTAPYRTVNESTPTELPFHFLVMPYHNGRPIAHYKLDGQFIINEELFKLDYCQRIALLTQIALYLSLFHNNSPRAGETMLHRDLHPANVLLCNRVYKGNQENYIFVTDYGLAVEVTDEIISQPRQGAYICSAPELFDSKEASTRSDVFSFGMLIVLFLNGINPYEIRYESKKQEKVSHEVNLDGFLHNLELPGPFKKVIEYLLTKFTLLTHAVDPYERATTDECLLFFTLMNNYNQLTKLASTKYPPPLHDYAIIITKLILVVENLWFEPSELSMVFNQADDFNHQADNAKNEVGESSIQLWKNVDFDAKPEFCISVVIIARYETLSQARLLQIATRLQDSNIREQVNQAITTKCLAYKQIGRILFPDEFVDDHFSCSSVAPARRVSL